MHYRDNRGQEGFLYLSSFAKWCGKCVCDASGEDFVMLAPIEFKLLEAFKDL